MADLRTLALNTLAEAFGIKRATPASRQVPGAPGQGWGSSSISFHKWDMRKALRDGYEINEWVFACVNAYARHASTVPWRVSDFESKESKSRFLTEFSGVPATERKEFFKDAHQTKRRLVGYNGFQPVHEKKVHMRFQPDDPLEQLLENPNPEMTRQEFVERAFQHKLLGGNAMWAKLRGKALGLPGNKTPYELWPLYPQATRIDIQGQTPREYIYEPNGGADRATVKKYRPEDVIHMRFPDPGQPVWGISPLMAAARAVDTDVMATNWQLNSFHNRAIPDMLVAFEEGLTTEKYREAKQLVTEQYRSRERAPWVLGNKATIQQMSLSPAEMDFIKSSGFTRQRICTAFGLWPAVIAVMEGVTLANMETVLKYHWIQAIIPALDVLMADINKYLVPDFGGSRFVWYDVSGVDALSEDYTERMRRAKIAHTIGVPATVLNDRHELGYDLEDVPLADEPIFPAGVVTATMILNGETGGGSANPNVAPEGGDPVDDGGESDPQEPDPDDVIPNDPGDNPDTQLDAELPDMAYFQNGNSDPHYGVRLWNEDEAVEWLRVQGITPDLDRSMRAGDTFEFYCTNVSLVSDWEATHDEKNGITILWENADEGIAWVRFYHGAEAVERRERLVERARAWGY